MPPTRFPMLAASITRDNSTRLSARPGRLRACRPRGCGARRARADPARTLPAYAGCRGSVRCDFGVCEHRCPTARAARTGRAGDRFRRGVISRGSIRRGRRVVRVASSIGPQSLGPVAHERVLDWWATAVDRQAQLRPPAERGELYGRDLGPRMARGDLAGCGIDAAGYWLAAAARGGGDLERALNEATAAWVRASLARDGGVALRADLDRLVVQGILPRPRRATRRAR